MGVNLQQRGKPGFTKRREAADMEAEATLLGRHSRDLPESDARLASNALSSCILPGMSVSSAPPPPSPANGKLCAFCLVTLTLPKHSTCLCICTAYDVSCEVYQYGRGFAMQQTGRQVHHPAWFGCW